MGTITALGPEYILLHAQDWSLAEESEGVAERIFEGADVREQTLLLFLAYLPQDARQQYGYTVLRLLIDKGKIVPEEVKERNQPLEVSAVAATQRLHDYVRNIWCANIREQNHQLELVAVQSAPSNLVFYE